METVPAEIDTERWRFWKITFLLRHFQHEHAQLHRFPQALAPTKRQIRQLKQASLCIPSRSFRDRLAAMPCQLCRLRRAWPLRTWTKRVRLSPSPGIGHPRPSEKPSWNRWRSRQKMSDTLQHWILWLTMVARWLHKWIYQQIPTVSNIIH